MSQAHHAFRRFVRSHSCVAADRDWVLWSNGRYLAAAPNCRKLMWEGVMEFAHFHHSGMGGKDVPDVGNGFPACTGHHHEFHTVGVESFQIKYDLNLPDLCAALARHFEHGEPFVEAAP